MQKFLTARKVVGVVSGSSTPVYLRGALSRNVRFERGRGFSAVPTQNETASTDPKPEHEGGTITELEAEGIPSPPPSKGPVRILNARVRNPLSIKRATAKSDRRQQYIDENIATIYPRLDSKETSELLPYETIRGEILKMQPGTSRDDLTIVVRGALS